MKKIFPVLVGILIKASQPDVSMDEVWKKLENVAKHGEEKGKVVVNGWTYRMTLDGDKNFTFSATAPKRRK